MALPDWNYKLAFQQEYDQAFKQEFDNVLKRCLTNGLPSLFPAILCDLTVISEILLQNGWKPTNMKNTNKRKVQKIISRLKQEHLNYTIYYNSLAPKKLAIVVKENRYCGREVFSISIL